MIWYDAAVRVTDGSTKEVPGPRPALPAVGGSQKGAFEESYSAADERWAFHYTSDPLTRYLRDRRLSLALEALGGALPEGVAVESVLVACGGVGGEGTFFRKRGFGDVTVSDFSSEALQRCNRLDPALKTLLLDAERMDVPDSSYDLVVVQDGLHHLPRPALGFAEMLRVARVAVILIEPHHGAVGRLLGQQWEVQGDAINYVFRWNAMMLEQCTRSYLLSREARVIAMRLWDHGLAVARAVAHLPSPLRLPAAKAIYAALAPVSRAGNMMVGVVLKDAGGLTARRLTSH